MGAGLSLESQTASPIWNAELLKAKNCDTTYECLKMIFTSIMMKLIHSCLVRCIYLASKFIRLQQLFNRK